MKELQTLVVAVSVAWFSCELADAGPICNSVRTQSIVVQRNIVVQNGFAVVPFAVPVAVPVATVNVPTVLYSFDANRGYQQSHQTHNADRSGFTEPRSRDEGSEHWTSDSRPSAVVLKCAKCHSGEAPKAGLDLSKSAALTTKQRLAAVARVVSDDPEERMPKGSTLSPTEIGNVLQELSRSE